MSENRNAQDGFKTVLMAGLSALTGGNHGATNQSGTGTADLIEHVLQNVQIPEQFKETIEDLASKGEGLLKGFDLAGALQGLEGGAEQVKQQVGQQVEQAEQKAEQAGNDAHGLVMSALEQLDHGQLTQVLGKAAGLISSLTGSK